jgi:hypothetical protein
MFMILLICGRFLLNYIEEQEAGNLYPETLFSHGEMPDEAMEKTLKLITLDDYTMTTKT